MCCFMARGNLRRIRRIPMTQHTFEASAGVSAKGAAGRFLGPKNCG